MSLTVSVGRKMRPLRSLAVVGLALASIWLATVPPAASASKAHSQPVFRTESHQVGDLYGIGTYIAQRYPTLVAPTLFRVAQTGVDWVREEFTASDMHSGPNIPYHFPRYDRVITREVHRGLHILGLLDYNDSWYRANHTWMGHRHIYRLTNQFVRFVDAVVRHYRHQIYRWQVWNEPDIRLRWRPKPRAADYAYLLRRTYTTIKDANPQARVVMAGPSGSDAHAVDFIHKVLRDHGRADIVAIQPYTWIPDWTLRQEVSELHRFHRPIWFTEMGWPGQAGCPQCQDPIAQADKMATLYLIGAIGGVRKVFWYDFRDDGIRQTFADHFGLVEYNYATKPAYRAFQIGLHYLNQATLIGKAKLSGDISIYRFSNHGHWFYVVWNHSAVEQSVDSGWSYRAVKAFDALGHVMGGVSRHRLHLLIPANSVEYLAPSGMAPTARPSYPIPVPPGHTK